MLAAFDEGVGGAESFGSTTSHTSTRMTGRMEVVGRDVTPIFHPAATRDRPLLSRRSAGEATGGFEPARCFSSSAANAAGVA